MPAAEADLFARTLFSDIDFSGGGVVVAVSGGSDSTALLLLVKAHLEKAAPSTRLLAITVDHDLRPGSADEAVAVGALCGMMGVEHRTVRWMGTKPATGVLAAAREARYRLLAEAAESACCDIVLTGHTADDQAETVSMRLARYGGRGLSGMAPATLHEWRRWLLRPLLGVRRSTLRAFLTRRSVGWFDDPTNENLDHERPRVRKALAEDATVYGLLETAAEAGAARRALGEAAAALIASHADMPMTGLVRLGPAFAYAADRPAAVYALRILLATVGGAEHLPDLDKVEGLFERLAGSQALRATLSRTIVDQRRGTIYLLREGRGLPAACPAVGPRLWDGRRDLTGNGEDARVAPVGLEAARRLALPVAGVPASLVTSALAAEPAAGDADGKPLPAGQFSVRPAVTPWARFLPAFDLAPAVAMAALIGAPALPRSPLRGHIGAA